MAARELTYEDLLRIAEVIRTASHFSEFRLKVGEIEVSVRRANGAGAAAPRPQPASLDAPPEGAPDRKVLSKIEIPDEVPAVRAPMVGTFYRAPSPGPPSCVAPASKAE